MHRCVGGEVEMARISAKDFYTLTAIGEGLGHSKFSPVRLYMVCGRAVRTLTYLLYSFELFPS